MGFLAKKKSLHKANTFALTRTYEDNNKYMNKTKKKIMNLY